MNKITDRGRRGSSHWIHSEGKKYDITKKYSEQIIKLKYHGNHYYRYILGLKWTEKHSIDKTPTPQFWNFSYFGYLLKDDIVVRGF